MGDESSIPAGLPPTSAKSSHSPSNDSQVTTAPKTLPADSQQNDVELIAHLKPCCHNLHNDCLTPWVERANSCPICRARFYTVELSSKVGGETFPPCPPHR
ncbi:hypothetical protein HC762_01775 [bacterium]|nr:hypothetical protein [bacterium]